MSGNAVQRAAQTPVDGLFVGADGRLSTSKTIAWLWTAVVAWMTITIGLIAVRYARGAGVQQFLDDKLVIANSPYLALIAPYSAGVLAKVTVTGLGGRTQKSKADQASAGDLIRDDTGATDLFDFQYVLFNLVAVLIVGAVFVKQPGLGPPHVPPLLFAFAGGSAGAYLANKATLSNAPQITTVVPSSARVREKVTAHGSNLVPPGATDADKTQVTVGGVAASLVEADGVAQAFPDRVAFVMPGRAGGWTDNADRQLVVTTVGKATALAWMRPLPDDPVISEVPDQPLRAETLFHVRGDCLTPPNPEDGAKDTIELAAEGVAAQHCSADMPKSPDGPLTAKLSQDQMAKLLEGQDQRTVKLRVIRPDAFSTDPVDVVVSKAAAGG